MESCCGKSISSRIVITIKWGHFFERLIQLLSELPLTAPFIWLAWISILRYSQLSRLREDYEFKVASALALDGYLKQAEEINSALRQALLEQAMKTFSENPLRLLSKDIAKDAHPLISMLDDKSLKDIVQAGIKTLIDKK